MTRAAHRHQSDATTRLAAIERFSRSKYSLGPFPIPPKRRVRNEFHYFLSPKAGHRPIECESRIEADAAYFAESQPDVTSITEQPLRIMGAIGNRPHYTLDLAFVYTDGRVVYHEIKPHKHIRKHEDGSEGPADWPFVRAWAEANGFLVDVLTDKDLEKSQQAIENWRMLLPFASESYEEPDPDLESAIQNLVFNGDATTVLQLEDRHPGIDPQTLFSHVAKLLHQGRLLADLNTSPFTPNTLLSKAVSSDE